MTTLMSLGRSRHWTSTQVDCHEAQGCCVCTSTVSWPQFLTPFIYSIVDNMSKLVDSPITLHPFLPKLLPGLIKVETTIGNPEVRSVVVPSPLSVRLARSLLVMPRIFLLSSLPRLVSLRSRSHRYTNKLAPAQSRLLRTSRTLSERVEGM